MDRLHLVVGANEGSPAGLIVMLAVMVLMIAAAWRVYTKAGKPGWAVLVPIYNVIVFLQIAGKPIWWIVLFFIPFVNLVAQVLVSLSVAERFGRGTGTGVGLAFLPFIFYPILGFGSATYGAGPAPGQPSIAPAA